MQIKQFTLTLLSLSAINAAPVNIEKRQLGGLLGALGGGGGLGGLLGGLGGGGAKGGAGGLGGLLGGAGGGGGLTGGLKKGITDQLETANTDLLGIQQEFEASAGGAADLQSSLVDTSKVLAGLQENFGNLNGISDAAESIAEINAGLQAGPGAAELEALGAQFSTGIDAGSKVLTDRVDQVNGAGLGELLALKNEVDGAKADLEENGPAGNGVVQDLAANGAAAVAGVKAGAKAAGGATAELADMTEAELQDAVTQLTEMADSMGIDLAQEKEAQTQKPAKKTRQQRKAERGD